MLHQVDGGPVPWCALAAGGSLAEQVHQRGGQLLGGAAVRLGLEGVPVVAVNGQKSMEPEGQFPTFLRPAPSPGGAPWAGSDPRFAGDG